MIITRTTYKKLNQMSDVCITITYTQSRRDHKHICRCDFNSYQTCVIQTILSIQIMIRIEESIKKKIKKGSGSTT